MNGWAETEVDTRTYDHDVAECPRHTNCYQKHQINGN